MFTENAFRIAFALSLSTHLLAASAGGFFHGKPPLEENREIEVTYLMPEEEPAEEIIQNLPREYDLKDKELQQAVRREEVKPSEPLMEENSLLSAEQYLEEKELELLEEYIQYYELIREKIKKTVARNYTRFREEGMVEVAFTLDKRGHLKNLIIDKLKSASSASLHKTALRGIERAAPFPAFPPLLKRDDLTFAIAIIFKKN